MLKSFAEMAERVAACSQKTVVLAGADDPHALEAVLAAHEKGCIDYLLVGEKDKTIEVASTLGKTVDQSRIVPAESGVPAAIAAVRQIREHRGDFLMKGKMTTSDLLKQVVNKEHGIPGPGIMSHIAILEAPAYHKLMFFSDAGMILRPTLAQKVSILENALTFLKKLGYDRPKVGVLAAAEMVNPKDPTSTDAAQLKELWENGRFPDCILEGPISFDLATVSEMAAAKNYESPVSGDVDLFLVPDYTAGNLLCKGIILMGNAKMAGCVLGAQAPVVLTSRGASEEEKYFSLLLCAALS